MAVCVVFGEQRTNELLMNPDLLTYSRPKVMRSVQLLFGIITLGIAAYIVSLSSYWYVVRAIGGAYSFLFFSWSCPICYR